MTDVVTSMLSDAKEIAVSVVRITKYRGLSLARFANHEVVGFIFGHNFKSVALISDPTGFHFR
jgi:hypothetical protein